MTTINTVYNFKTLKAGKFAELLAEYDEASQATIRASFEVAENGDAKRKPESCQLTMPEFYDALPDDLSRKVIQRTVEDFVKAMYIDNFQPVGNHAWDHIAATMAEQAKRGGGLSITVSDEQWQLASATVANFWRTTGRPDKLGNAITAIIAGKFTANSIRKNLGRDDADTISKLEGIIGEWAAWIAENDSENAEDVGAVFAAISKRIDKMLKREETELLADLL